MASSSTNVDHGVWLTNSSAPFHMTPHMELLFAYEKYNGGNVYLGNDLIVRIIGAKNARLL